MNRIEFLPDSTQVRYAIAASFDMSGFSRFCLHPNAHGYLNRYLSHLFGLFDNAFKDLGRDLWKDTSKLVQVPRPDSNKYTGDGALLLWVRDNNDDFTNELCTSVVKALRDFQMQLPIKIAEWERQWRVNDLPKSARFGIALGPVHPLEKADFLGLREVVDHAGYCINLAVRLQDHCPEVGFIVQSLLHPQLDGLRQLKALNMKGSADEAVYVFDEDLLRALKVVPHDTMAQKFSGINT